MRKVLRIRKNISESIGKKGGAQIALSARAGQNTKENKTERSKGGKDGGVSVMPF